jgi:hypothetical protein
MALLLADEDEEDRSADGRRFRRNMQRMKRKRIPDQGIQNARFRDSIQRTGFQSSILSPGVKSLDFLYLIRICAFIFPIPDLPICVHLRHLRMDPLHSSFLICGSILFILLSYTV